MSGTRLCEGRWLTDLSRSNMIGTSFCMVDMLATSLVMSSFGIRLRMWNNCSLGCNKAHTAEGLDRAAKSGDHSVGHFRSGREWLSRVFKCINSGCRLGTWRVTNSSSLWKSFPFTPLEANSFNNVLACVWGMKTRSLNLVELLKCHSFTGYSIKKSLIFQISFLL